MKLGQRSVRPFLVPSLVAAALVAPTPPALASFHLVKIREVYVSAEPAYIELQMHASGQNLVAGKQIKTFGPTGNLTGTYTFPANVPNGENQRTILIGNVDIGTTTFPGVTPDLSMGIDTPLQESGGEVCFFDPGTSTNIDCVAWGNFTGDGETGAPAPALATGGEQSIERTIARGCPTALDPSDDSDNSAADFAINPSPLPRNNASIPTEQPCPPALQGLKAKVRGNRATVSGAIQPPAPGEPVKLTLFANGSPLRRIAQKIATLNADSKFKKRFKVPRDSTRCKVTVGFQGNRLGKKKFPC